MLFVSDNLVRKILVTDVRGDYFPLEIIIVFVGFLVNDPKILEVPQSGLSFDDCGEFLADFFFNSFLFFVNAIGRDSYPA